MKSKTLLAIVVILLVLLVVMLGLGFGQFHSNSETTQKPTTSTPGSNSQPSAPINTKVTVGLNQQINIRGILISVEAVTEDSRCPSDVNCIQAGKVVVGIAIVSPSGSTTVQLSPGTSADYTTTKGVLSVALDDVKPYPISTHKPTNSEYRFSFTIKSK